MRKAIQRMEEEIIDLRERLLVKKAVETVLNDENKSLKKENESLKKELEEYKACVRFIKDKMLSELYFAVSEQNIVEIDGVLLLFNGANVLKVSKEQYRLIRKILEGNGNEQ